MAVGTEQRHVAELIKAEELFMALKLPEAYQIFRRFYDRLPFQQFPEHALYMGHFVRTLYELGREEELKFYRRELGRLYKRTASMELGYQLARTHLTTERSELFYAKEILEDLVKRCGDLRILAKIKMALAHCYDVLDGDVAACTLIIDSIEESGDRYMDDLTQIWKAKNLRDRNRLSEAEAVLTQVLVRVSPDFNWYAYFSAKIIMGGIHLAREEYEQLVSIVTEVRAYCDKNPLRTVRNQIEALAESIKRRGGGTASLEVRKLGVEHQLTHSGKVLRVRGELPWERLLLLLLEQRVIDKAEIIEHLYARPYVGEIDNRLVYCQIHSVKKNLRRIGLPAEVISREPEGYRWTYRCDVLGE